MNILLKSIVNFKCFTSSLVFFWSIILLFFRDKNHFPNKSKHKQTHHKFLNLTQLWLLDIYVCIQKTTVSYWWPFKNIERLKLLFWNLNCSKTHNIWAGNCRKSRFYLIDSVHWQSHSMVWLKEGLWWIWW